MRASDIPYGILVPEITTDDVEEAMFKSRRSGEPVIAAVPKGVDPTRAMWRVRSAARRALGENEITKWKFRTSRDDRYIVVTRR